MASTKKEKRVHVNRKLLIIMINKHQSKKGENMHYTSSIFTFNT